MNFHKISMEVSARHIPLSKKDFEELFGKNYELTTLKRLSQFGEFATWETLTIENNFKKIVLKKGVTVPKRHIHYNSKEARELGIKEGMFVSVKTITC